MLYITYYSNTYQLMSIARQVGTSADETQASGIGLARPRYTLKLYVCPSIYIQSALGTVYLLGAVTSTGGTEASSFVHSSNPPY